MSQRSLARIRIIGRLMQPAVTIAAVLLPTALVGVALFTPHVLLRSPAASAFVVPWAFLPPWIGLAALAVLAVPTGILTWGLWQLRQVFAEHRRGRAFSQDAAARLRRFATALFASALLQPLASAALSGIVTVSAGTPAIQLSISWNDLFHILMGGLVLAIACANEEGVRLSEENASFV